MSGSHDRDCGGNAAPYVLGALTEVEHDAFLAHLDTCAVCREEVAGEFDRTISLPLRLEPDGIKAEYRDGILALFLPRSERDKPRTITVS